MCAGGQVAAGRPAGSVLSATLQHGRWEGPFTQIRKEGKRFPARVIVTLRRDDRGQPIGIAMNAKDITTENAAAQAEAKFRGLFEAGPEMRVITDAAGQIVLINSRAKTHSATIDSKSSASR